MKFLSKHTDSKILIENFVYKKNSPENNKKLKEMLLNEQKNFCAYTEKYISELDSIEVEHFNSSKKYNDDYFNYYAVVRKSNEYKIKKDKIYLNNNFFSSLFFQDKEEFNNRILFVDNMYVETNEDDQEAKDLIDFLGFNHQKLFVQRLRHINRLRQNFKDANYSKNECIEYFKEYKEDLSFITAIEKEFELDLLEII